jgi:predicted AAA+ superfamily ATPase
MSIKQINKQSSQSEHGASKWKPASSAFWENSSTKVLITHRIVVSGIKVKKTLIKNKKIYVVNDVFIYVSLCGCGNRKRITFLIVIRSLLRRHPKSVDIFSQK